MLKKISLLFCACCLALSTNANASPYAQVNLTLSPSTTFTLVDFDITNKDVFGGSSFGIEGILGTQGRLFAYEAGLAYTKNPEYVNIDSSILDLKVSALLAPKIGLGFMAIIPYIGPQIGYSSYTVGSEAKSAFLYGGKAGIKLPFTLLYIDLGASYLKRRGKIFSDVNTQVSDNFTLNLGVGFRLF